MRMMDFELINKYSYEIEGAYDGKFIVHFAL